MGLFSRRKRKRGNAKAATTPETTENKETKMVASPDRMPEKDKVHAELKKGETKPFTMTTGAQINFDAKNDSMAAEPEPADRAAEAATTADSEQTALSPEQSEQLTQDIQKGLEEFSKKLSGDFNLKDVDFSALTKDNLSSAATSEPQLPAADPSLDVSAVDNAVDQSQKVVHEMVSQQYSSVLAQNSVLLQQIEQLQKANSTLNDKIEKWLDYREQATDYISRMQIRRQDEISQLKRQNQKEVEAVNEKWLKQFDDRSDQIEKRYQNLQVQSQKILADKIQDQRTLETQITDLKK